MTDKQWIDETCGTCLFDIENLCRKNPPTLNRHSEWVPSEISSGYTRPATYEYPKVSSKNPACSCWREEC